MPTPDDQGVLLSRGSVKRIQRAVRAVEGSAASPAGPGPASLWNPGVRRARVTTAIPTGTWAAPSSTGKVRLSDLQPDGSWADGDEVPVYNDFTTPSPIPVGRVVKVAWIGGTWWLVSASCS